MYSHSLGNQYSFFMLTYNISRALRMNIILLRCLYSQNVLLTVWYLYTLKRSYKRLNGILSINGNTLYSRYHRWDIISLKNNYRARLRCRDIIYISLISISTLDRYQIRETILSLETSQNIPSSLIEIILMVHLSRYFLYPPLLLISREL